jgi:hypothetical protein
MKAGIRMNKIYLVYYMDSSEDEGYSIEGFCYRKKDFTEWLRVRNKDRKAQGELIEKASEFELREINSLTF